MRQCRQVCLETRCCSVVVGCARTPKLLSVLDAFWQILPRKIIGRCEERSSECSTLGWPSWRHGVTLVGAEPCCHGDTLPPLLQGHGRLDGPQGRQGRRWRLGRCCCCTCFGCWRCSFCCWVAAGLLGRCWALLLLLLLLLALLGRWVAAAAGLPEAAAAWALAAAWRESRHRACSRGAARKLLEHNWRRILTTTTTTATTLRILLRLLLLFATWAPWRGGHARSREQCGRSTAGSLRSCCSSHMRRSLLEGA